MNHYEILVVAVATWQAVEVWSRGEIFAGARAATQSWHNWDGVKCHHLRRLAGRPWSRAACCLLRRLYGARTFLGELLDCPWCLSVWVSAALVLAWLAVPVAGPAASAVLAASRLANVFSDLSRRR